ncbi:MAG: hypothetical protein Q9201_005763 [Fulgogasparrea decipioides]
MAADFLKTHGIDLQEVMSRVQFNNASTSISEYDDNARPESSAASPSDARPTRHGVCEIRGVRLAGRDPDSKWDVSIRDNRVASITSHKPRNTIPSSKIQILDSRDSFLAPSLCHPHIHLDKCFLLNDPKYADISIEKGDFAEAMSLTSRAKSRFSDDDLLRRGRWLIEESIAAGVTCMRAFVEVDTMVRFKCLDAGLLLKRQYRDACDVQICAFAQGPVFSGDDAAECRTLMEEALQRDGVDVVGSTPYVEADEIRMRANIDWAVSYAMQYNKHLDLHLDYSLDADKEPMVYHLLDILHDQGWPSKAKQVKRIMLGHCTRLTLFTADQWHDLHSRIGDLPVSFVGLPTSDLFMMGKPSEREGGGERVRGTLQIPQMIQQYDIDGAISVNNVGNAFTPQGNCNPLSVASMCVGIYQAGTKRDTETLYECISTRAKVAIGYGDRSTLVVREGDEADLVLFHVPEKERHRGRRTLQEVVYDPPKARSVLHGSHVIETNAD